MVIFCIAHLKNTTRRTPHLNLKNFRKKSIFAIFFRNFENPPVRRFFFKILRPCNTPSLGSLNRYCGSKLKMDKIQVKNSRKDVLFFGPQFQCNRLEIGDQQYFGHNFWMTDIKSRSDHRKPSQSNMDYNFALNLFPNKKQGNLRDFAQSFYNI